MYEEDGHYEGYVRIGDEKFKECEMCFDALIPYHSFGDHCPACEKDMEVNFLLSELENLSPEDQEEVILSALYNDEVCREIEKQIKKKQAIQGSQKGNL